MPWIPGICLIFAPGILGYSVSLGMEIKDIRQIVGACVDQLLQEQDVDEAIQDDTPLFSSGLLDSMALIRLVAMLERQLDITMSPGQVSVDTFDTMAGIMGAIRSSAS